MFPQIFGKYVLERAIASGGMAHVYLATLRGAVGFRKRLVVKQIRPELASDPAFVERFVEEAKTTVGLNHPNIVPVYELGVELGVYYIALEFCEGITLGDLLTQSGPLSASEGAYLGVEICRALDYAHRRAQVIHRDVTPRNVLIDEEGAVRVIDFGIAAPVESDGELKEVFGSPGHMPPEQLAGRVTPATDVFAVGALLLEAWSGRAPFRRGNAKESHAAARAGEAPPPSAAHPELAELDRVLLTAVAPEMAERLENAELLGRALRDFLRRDDVGDIARRLGERVRAARRKAAGSVASIPDLERSPGVSELPSVPDGSTQTFAAHQAIEVWTRRVDGGELAVDQLLTQTPEARWETDEVGQTPPSAARRDEAQADAELGHTPKMAQAEGEPGHTPRMAVRLAEVSPADEQGHSSGKRTSAPRSSSGGEPSNSKPPTGEPSSSEPSSDEPAVTAIPGGWRALAVVLLAFGGFSVWFWGFGRSPRGDVQAPPTASMPAALETPPTASAGSVNVPDEKREAGAQATNGPEMREAGADVVNETDAAPRPSAPTPAPGAAPSTHPKPPSSAVTSASADAPAAELGYLTFTAVPAAQVTVGGRARGTTPLMALGLRPGSYSVVFSSASLGESVSTQVQLRGGQAYTLHADFTGATPRIIQR
ncbi:MAG: serine/threonine protein kinase [Polyangiaceae bacterium]|nr:serine/threonine protein kinase [Polyangiaceae bacterium]MCW5790041.1 serine/threonine protein kinase [Polyangiaceae bacterium]